MNWKKWIFFVVLVLVIVHVLVGIVLFQSSPADRAANFVKTESEAAQKHFDLTESPSSKSSTHFPKVTANYRRPGADLDPNSQALKVFLKAADPSAQWFVSQSPTGRVTAISGGAIQQDLSNSENALAFAQRVALMLGYDSRQVVIAKNQLPETADSRSVSFAQEIDGYSVFGGALNVFTRKNDESVYYITNELQKFRNVETRISFGLNEAEKAVQERFFNAKNFKIEGHGEKPVIVANNSNEGELCWQIQVRYQKRRFERRILFLSVKNLELIREVDLVIPN